MCMEAYFIDMKHYLRLYKMSKIRNGDFGDKIGLNNGVALEELVSSFVKRSVCLQRLLQYNSS